MLIERLMWGSDWEDRLTALLTSRGAVPVCAACNAPVEARDEDATPRLCARCDAAEAA